MADVMLFGKHKGKNMEDVPLDYLMWCLKEIRKCPRNVLQEIDRRTGLNPSHGKSAAKYLKVKANPLTYKCTIEGRDYSMLRDEWELAGGNAEDCPFGEEYEGPSLCWQGGKPIIVSSEFRRLP